MSSEGVPSVSVIVAAFNNRTDIGRLLESISTQDFPRERIEVIVADGGSTDGTVELCEKWGAHVVPNPHVSEKTFSGGKTVALRAARNPIVLLLDSDNILSTPNFLSEVVKPFMWGSGVVGVSSIISSDPSWSSFERYAGYVYDPADYRHNLACEERALMEQGFAEPFLVLKRRPNEKVYVGNGTAVLKSAFLEIGGYDFDLEAGRRLYRAGTMVLSTRSVIFHHNAVNLQNLVRKKIRGSRDLVKHVDIRASSDGLIGLVLVPTKSGRARLALQLVRNLSVFHPAYVAVSEARRLKDPAFLWHVVMCPLVTVVHIASVLTSRQGWGLAKSILTAVPLRNGRGSG